MIRRAQKSAVPEIDIQEWMSWAFRGLVMVACWFGSNTISNLNQSITNLSSILSSMDKRLSAVEVAREVNFPRFVKMEQEHEIMKQDIAVNKAHIAEFLSSMERRPHGTR